MGPEVEGHLALTRSAGGRFHGRSRLKGSFDDPVRAVDGARQWTPPRDLLKGAPRDRTFGPARRSHERAFLVRWTDQVLGRRLARSTAYTAASMRRSCSVSDWYRGSSSSSAGCRSRSSTALVIAGSSSDSPAANRRTAPTRSVPLTCFSR